MTLSGATTSGQSGLGSNGNEVVLYIHKSFSIIGALPSNCLMLYPGHSWRSLTLLQRSSCYILQSQPAGPLIGGFLPFCREAVGVFYSPNPLGHSLERSYPSAEKQLVHSTTPTNLASRWRILTLLQRSSWCILRPQPTGRRRMIRKTTKC